MAHRLTKRGIVDAVVALGFLALGWLSTGATSTSEPAFTYAARDVLFVVLLVLATLPYAARRRWPAAAFLISLLSVTAIWSLGYNGGGLPLLLLVGAYWVAVARQDRYALGCLGAAVACFSYLLVADGAPFGGTEWVAAVLSVAGALGLGRSVRIRGDLAEARARAAEEEALRRAREERLRMSAEMHDIIGHSLASISVQAGVGRHLLESDPDRAAEALDNIAEVSRRSLAELRTVIAAMRDHPSELHPSPGLADLPALIESTRAAGISVSLTLPADIDAVPRQAAASAYRVVREALTNVVRHAQATSAEVVVRHREGRLQVSVLDDGVGAADPDSSSGHGIVGMRERVEALGGSLSAGAEPGGGFLVMGTLPTGSAR